MNQRRESRIADFLDRYADAFFRYGLPPNIAEWPTWARRTFILTLPVSGLLWCAWCAAFFVALAFFVGCVMVLGVLFWASLPFAWAFVTIRDLWEASPPTSADASLAVVGEGGKGASVAESAASRSALTASDASSQSEMACIDCPGHGGDREDCCELVPPTIPYSAPSLAATLHAMGYQRVFNAISAAVSLWPESARAKAKAQGYGISISVAALIEALTGEAASTSAESDDGAASRHERSASNEPISPLTHPETAVNGEGLEEVTERLARIAKGVPPGEVYYGAVKYYRLGKDINALLRVVLQRPGGWSAGVTAPRDGSHILACDVSQTFGWLNGKPLPPVQTVVHWFEDPDEPGFYTSINETEPQRPFNLTHWKPLDGPPPTSADASLAVVGEGGKGSASAISAVAVTSDRPTGDAQKKSEGGE